MKFGVIIFPGSNCDQDSYNAAIAATGQQATMLWHDSHDLENCDAIIVPGGFNRDSAIRVALRSRSAHAVLLRVFRRRRRRALRRRIETSSPRSNSAPSGNNTARRASYPVVNQGIHLQERKIRYE